MKRGPGEERLGESPKTVCENVDRCPLFPLFSMESTLNVWKALYCHSSQHKSCARFVFVNEHKKPPPADMLPDGTKLKVLPDR